MNATASAPAGWIAPLAQAARRNLVPGLCLQAVAVAIILAYYRLPAARGIFESIAAAKAGGGFLFSALSTAVAAGVIPWMVDAWRGRIPRRLLRLDLLFVTLLWAWRGSEVDLFYRCQAMLFGAGADAGTILRKVAFDMLLYAPLWAQPIQVTCYRLRDAGYDVAAFRAAWGWGDFARQVWTVQIGGWMVWIPAVAIIYSLPSDLQIALFAVMICFWSLLLAAITGRR